MFNILKTVILNSIKNTPVKTSLGRWAPVNYKQQESRAMWSSIDNCGDCNDHFNNHIDLYWIFDRKYSKNSKKEMTTSRSSIPYMRKRYRNRTWHGSKCITCGSLQHTSENCPNKLTKLK
jgi:hypothetical protein